ncbi:MAG: DUF6714 family protein [Luteolibacter sp.]|uniref:DUF6714 family protein n=1 Tax=Luteolibacter sp. TaxID=1962973 RepID=UPI003262ED19
MTVISTEDLSARIFDAFAGVCLDGGVSLIEAEYADRREIAPVHLVALEEKCDWTKLIDDRLCDYMSTFCFTDYRGFRFYIAPYMIWTLRNFRDSSAFIADCTIYAIEPGRSMFVDHPFSEVFSPKQIKSMRDFLLFACENGDHLDAKVARSNLTRLLQTFPEIQETEQVSLSGGDKPPN